MGCDVCVCDGKLGSREESEPDDAVQEPQEDDVEQEQSTQRAAGSPCQVCHSTHISSLLSF